MLHSDAYRTAGLRGLLMGGSAAAPAAPRACSFTQRAASSFASPSTFAAASVREARLYGAAKEKDSYAIAFAKDLAAVRPRLRRPPRTARPRALAAAARTLRPDASAAQRAEPERRGRVAPPGTGLAGTMGREAVATRPSRPTARRPGGGPGCARRAAPDTIRGPRSRAAGLGERGGAASKAQQTPA